MTDLLEHMGIQRQSFYNTFESKEQVFLEVVELYFSQMRERMQNILRTGRTPIESIENVFRFWEQLGETGGCRGCLIGNAVAEFGATDQKMAKLLQRNLRIAEDAFFHVFKHAIDEGYLPGDRDPRGLARTLVTFGQGLALMSKTGMKTQALKDVTYNMKRAVLG